MTLPGSGGATGAAAAGSTATTVGVGDGATSDAAMVVAVAEPALDTNVRAAGLGDSGVSTGWISARAATFATCTVCASPLSDDGFGSDLGVVDVGTGDDVGIASGDVVSADVGETMTSGGELLDGFVDCGVAETGVPSWSAEAVGDVLVDSLVESAEAVGLFRWLVEDEV